MLSILGNAHRLCDGLTRRELLRLGGLSLFGTSLADSVARGGKQLTRGGGKAKACILLFPYGSPSQHETFDPKPDAPAEVRGELGSIPTRVPGLRVCDRLPRVASIADRITVVRSVTHPYPVHGVAYAVTGMPTYTPDLEARPRDSRHWPFIGSVVDHLEARRSPGERAEPRNVALPWMLNSKTDLLVNAGPFAAFLGQAHDPVWTDFDGRGTHEVPIYTQDQKKRFHDPFGGTLPGGRFSISAGGDALPDVPIERLNLRRSLLNQLDHARSRLDGPLTAGVVEHQRAQAYHLLTSSKMRLALDIAREPLQLRERYGMTLFGQSCLAARRLVEAGCKFVTVFWDGYGQFGNCAWDTHQNHFPRLKEYLLPGFDRAYPALIEDLEQRGLLDETLVLWLSEHGRTPRIDTKWTGGGRDHWSRVYSVALAGGGVARGRVVGESDRIGGDVKQTPVSPKDLLATTLHLLGHDADSHVLDREGRPVRAVGDGRVREEVLE
ncbi:MAG: DUF1501 domain-containing protein [Planctomycetia bacterium]|nr:DUF1501 domain-containing protein [Planctomycetia bacterium]